MMMTTSQRNAALSLLLLLLQLVDARPPLSKWGLQSLRNNNERYSQSTMMLTSRPILQRGGAQDIVVDSPQPASASSEPPTTSVHEEESLDDKVRRAMEKLGLTPPPQSEDDAAAATCAGGVCEMPQSPQDPDVLADQIAASMNIDRSLAMAAIAATASTTSDGTTPHVFNEVAARQMILQELQVIRSVAADAPEVLELVQEGNSIFEARRALAFADGNMDNARAILLAEREEAPEDKVEPATATAATAKSVEEVLPMKTIEVKSEFDPTNALPAEPQAATPAKPAVDKSKVVFDATSKQIQELVLESPVPVLLDVYADWCGPCKVLGPALEDMAVKSGGAFRLVKINTDSEQPVSSALQVTALPTVFGVKNGKIVNMFQGMPSSQEAMQSFMMGLMVSESHFNPAVTEDEKAKYAELTTKLVKMAGSACFSFAARERLQDRVTADLDKLVEQTGDFSIAEESTQVLKSLLLNVIRDPYALKYRSVKLDNKVIAAKVKQYPGCLAILKNVGFSTVSETELALHKSKSVINIAPLIVARDTIDKWLDASRYEVAKAARKRKDELDRIQVQKELEAAKANEPEEDDDEVEEEVDPDACTMKVRIEGKKKVHALDMRADDTLANVLSALPVTVPAGEEVKITCTAKRLVVNAADETTMQQSLRHLGLLPASSIVVAIGSNDSTTSKKASKANISERSAKKKKKGSHTMQSIGIYAKDDNAKGELIDGGGGVMYEHDVSDAEDQDADDKTEAKDVIPKTSEDSDDEGEQPK